jgi:hypothetical protein
MMDTRAKWSAALLAVLLLAGGLFSCDNNSRKGVCLYAGVSYAAQDKFTSIDGCNTCSCSSDGAVGCTTRACADGGFSEGGVADGPRESVEGGGDTSHDGSSPADGTSTADVSEAPAGVCSLETAYRFFDDGGLRAFYDDSRIAPPRTHTLTRKNMSASTIVDCSYEIPCSPGSAVDLPAIQKAIGHPDVQEALAKATRPHYGSDPRPVDGTVWVFERADGRGFSLGGGNVPAGLRALETVLRQLTTETRAAPQCAALRP